MTPDQRDNIKSGFQNTALCCLFIAALIIALGAIPITMDYIIARPLEGDVGILLRTAKVAGIPFLLFILLYTIKKII